MYAFGAEACLEGSIAALTDTIAVSLLSTSYTPNLSTDEFYSTVPSGAVVAGPVTLTSVTGSGGTLSAANTSFSSVTGSQINYVLVFKNTGTSSTSRLICLFDTATGLPATPNGGTITVAWASGQIFTLCEALRETEKSMVEKSLDRIAKLIGWRGKESPGGIWLPEPQLVF